MTLVFDWAFDLILAVEQRSQWCNMNVGGHALPNRKAAGRNAVDAQDGRDIQDMEEAGAAVNQPADPITQSELNPYTQKKILIKGRCQKERRSHINEWRLTLDPQVMRRRVSKFIF